MSYTFVLCALYLLVTRGVMLLAYLVLLQENSFFYCLDHTWIHLLVIQIPTGESTDVGPESPQMAYTFVLLCSTIYVLMTTRGTTSSANLGSFTSCSLGSFTPLVVLDG
jgi:hypothetical protein